MCKFRRLVKSTVRVDLQWSISDLFAVSLLMSVWLDLIAYRFLNTQSEMLKMFCKPKSIWSISIVTALTLVLNVNEPLILKKVSYLRKVLCDVLKMYLIPWMVVVWVNWFQVGTSSGSNGFNSREIRFYLVIIVEQQVFLFTCQVEILCAEIARLDVSFCFILFLSI